MPQAFAPVVGTHFRGGEAKRLVNAVIASGGSDEWTFAREPENEYDENAIAVYLPDENGAPEHVGYVAKVNNHDLAGAMDEGAELRAKMIDVEGRKPVLLIEWDDEVEGLDFDEDDD